MGLPLLSVRTEVSDWLMYHVCVISNFSIILCLGFTLVLLNFYLQFVTGFSFLRAQMEALNQSENNSTEDEEVIDPITISVNLEHP